MPIPILDALDSPQINRFIPYMLDDRLHVEKKFPNTDDIDAAGYTMKEFKKDNTIVIKWFSQIQNDFKKWHTNQSQKPASSVTLAVTGSRSFNASYTESDLECAIVSDDFDDFLSFCKFLHTEYSNGHTFIALKTQAGLPLLIIKGDSGFKCPKLAKLYPGKTLPQFEITFRHPKVHQMIQQAGINFFSKLNSHELESYVFNKRYIELLSRNLPKNATVEDKPLKNVLDEFKSALSASLKCLPSGVLQDTPLFNKAVFETAVNIHDANTPPDLLHINKGGATNAELIATFFNKIQNMHEYGVLLKAQNASKGQTAITLAKELMAMANHYFSQEPKRRNFAEFSQTFSTLLHSKDREMSVYRTSWNTIISNIAIALTGIGAIFIVGKLIYSKATQKRALFFFQESKTTSEQKIAEVEDAMAPLSQLNELI